MKKDEVADRQSVLNDLINFKKELSFLRTKLLEFEWDSENELVVIRFMHLENVLTRYLNGELKQDEVNEWANLIEMREDIGLDPRNEDLLKDLIFELANPELTTELTVDRARELLEKLK